MRVLILEDEPLTALDLQMVVEGCGHDVVALCSTIAEARRTLEHPLDFAFLDIDLPDGKSFDLANRLAAAGIPFAFVSASARNDLPAHLRHAHFIAKPYQCAAIRNCLGPARAIAC